MIIGDMVTCNRLIDKRELENLEHDVFHCDFYELIEYFLTADTMASGKQIGASKTMYLIYREFGMFRDIGIHSPYLSESCRLSRFDLLRIANYKEKDNPEFAERLREIVYELEADFR